MLGRFRALDAGYVDSVALEQRRNPHYREYPPGVANERVELPIVFGMIDFTIYVLAVCPFAARYEACFYLWCLTIPFGFLSAAMPVGPISAWYWRRSHPRNSLPAESLDQMEKRLTLQRNNLHALAVESIKVECELAAELPNAGDLHFAFETQIRQAKETRAQVNKEIVRLDSEIAVIKNAIVQQRFHRDLF